MQPCLYSSHWFPISLVSHSNTSYPVLIGPPSQWSPKLWNDIANSDPATANCYFTEVIDYFKKIGRPGYKWWLPVCMIFMVLKVMYFTVLLEYFFLPSVIRYFLMVLCMYACMSLSLSLSIYIYIYIFIKWNLSTWPQRVLNTHMRGWVLLLLYKWLEFGLFPTIICIYTYNIYTYAYTYTRVHVYTYIHTYMHKEIREERGEREKREDIYIYIYALPISWNHP